MKTNNKTQYSILLITSIILMLLIQVKTKAQPYYFYKDFISDREVNINKLNLNNSSESIFIEGIYPLAVFKEDGYQKWLITALDGHVKIYDINNSLIVKGFEIDQGSNKDLFVLAIPSQDLLFLSTSESENEWIYETNIIHYYNLELIKTSTSGMTPFSFASSNGDFIYQISEDSSANQFVERYSTELDSIISSTYLSTILTNVAYPTFKAGYLGKALFCYNEIPSDITTKKYQVYDIDNDNLFTPISYPYRSYGYLTPNAEYVLIQKSLWAPELPRGENFTGEINIYNPNSGALLKELTLPPNGKILLFDNYPNNIYYAIEIEEPTRQIYTLKMDSIFNVLDLISLAPSSAIVNSPPFTLRAYGQGFDSLSTVYFNDTSKTTSFISDTVLTAEISTSDISVVGNYPVWVIDEWGTSDTLHFSVLHEPPILTSISPGIVLRYISGGSIPTGLTATATGNNFSDSSMVYFNGNAKATTIISDTVLTFPITGSEMSTLGNSTVWIRSYGTNSDTLTFSVTDNLPQTVTPTLQCVHQNGFGSYTAYFGYANNNNVSVYVPIGSKNKFAPSTIDRGQPKLFLTGTHTNVFSVNFNGKNLTWTLDQASVSANSSSTPCP